MRIFFLLLAGLALVSSPVSAQDNSYRFRLNGDEFATNPRVMAGPRGCNSDLYNLRTRQMECQGDPRAFWSLQVARFCGAVEPDYGDYNPRRGRCVNAIVAVGRECPRLPRTCQYFMARDIGQWTGGREIQVTEISTLGNELWIISPRDSRYARFSCFYLNQENPYTQPPNC